MRRIWRDYRLEVILGFCILLGIFLLVEQFNIRQSMLEAAQALVAVLGNGIRTTLDAVANFLSMRSTSDLVGLGLIVVAGTLLVWRERRRIMTSPKLSDKACPVCGSELHRVHRARGDRILALFVPVRRYACANRECGWRGLRVSSAKRRKSKAGKPRSGVAHD